jgi:2-oxoglutarate ferredoxin oxidoreductase subunit alpha
VPGGKALVIVDSDEHTPQGHLSEDLDSHTAQQDKRMRKFAGMSAETMPPELYGPADADTLLICWGSTYGPAREAVDLLNARGQSAAMLHFAQVWPIGRDAAATAIGRRKRIICVEGNQTGQFAQVLRAEGLIGEVERLGKYDGLPMTGTWIAERIAK